jgi:hypothetical protein
MGVQEEDGGDDNRHDAIIDVPTETPFPLLRNRAGNKSWISDRYLFPNLGAGEHAI